MYSSILPTIRTTARLQARRTFASTRPSLDLNHKAGEVLKKGCVLPLSAAAPRSHE